MQNGDAASGSRLRLDGGQNTLPGVIESYWMVVGTRENRRKMLPVYFLFFLMFVILDVKE